MKEVKEYMSVSSPFKLSQVRSVLITASGMQSGPVSVIEEVQFPRRVRYYTKVGRIKEIGRVWKNSPVSGIVWFFLP